MFEKKSVSHDMMICHKAKKGIIFGQSKGKLRPPAAFSFLFRQ